MAILSRIDANRYRRTYPYIRRVPVFKFLNDSNADENMIVEVASVTFTNSNQETYNFTESFTSAPSVTATANNESVNVYVSSISTSSVTINASAQFTGAVEIHAIQTL